MPKGTTRSKAIPRLAIEQAESFLQDLPKREKESLSISEAIAGMSDTVRAAMAKGYSYDEVADMLSDKLGISVSAWSLRRYIPAGTRKSKKADDAPKRGRRKKEAAAEIEMPVAIVEAPSAPVIEPEPIIEATPEPEAVEVPKTRRATSRRTTKTIEPEVKPAAKSRTTRGKSTAAKAPAKTTKTTARNNKKK